MAIEVFNRYENKYLVDYEKFLKIKSRVSDFCSLDPYNEKNKTYKIYNIYYDTDDNYLIKTSLRKPNYKEKLRLRSYENVTKDSKVYIEIKKKVRGIVNKRRSCIKLKEAYDFLDTGEMPNLTENMNKQVLMEVSYLLKQYNLSKKLYLSYERLAYFGEGNHDLRISFDMNILSRREDLNLESESYGQKILEDGKFLIEVKSQESIPIWLARTLSEYSVYPTSFSKYGTEYNNFIEKQSKGLVYSFNFETENLNQNNLLPVY